MGDVWRGWDPLLGRAVALKFLRTDRRTPPERFLREARAQARVEHEHVCQVYEVGEDRGVPYIAMQLIEGQPLDEAAAEMTLEQKVTAVAEVAEALHAAHRLGLVHRDVKPSNVLVTRTEDGGFKPWVLDFGLAVDPASPRLTVHGLVVGTPAYMSPEQARGEVHRLDRRSDVYSLGATFHELLSGRPAFEGASAHAVMLSILEREPEPLRKLRPDLPADLETVVSKCLEKEPSRRYESARALAQDLRRFLDGEPVAARRAGRLARLVRKARKHRTATAVAAASAAASLVFAGLGIRALAFSARQQELARELGQEVERVEWTLREERLLPLHDVGGARARVRQRLEWLALQPRTLGSAAVGPSEYARGRGHLALGELEEAVARLEAARRAGTRSPDVSWALGRALAELYRRGMRASDLLPGKEAKEARRRELAERYRDPALERLREARGSTVAPTEWIEGLIAFGERRYADALAKATEAARQRPALYEARQLAADVHVQAGRELEEKGDYEGAAARYAAASGELALALEVARSDAALWTRSCVAHLYAGTVATRVGRHVDAPFVGAAASCANARRADPADGAAADVEAQLRWRWAEIAARDGKLEEADRLYAEGAAAAREAIRLEPGLGSAWNSLGISLWGRAEVAMQSGNDPSRLLSEAAEALRRAHAIDPGSAGSASDLGSVLFATATWQAEHGLDPGAALGESIRFQEAAVRLAPARSALWTNLGNGYFARAEALALRGRAPDDDARRAIAAYETAIGLAPQNAAPHNNAGEAELLLGLDAFRRGRDPLPLLASAAARFERSLASNPKLVDARRGSAGVHLLRARIAAACGESPVPELAGARRALEAAREQNPRSAVTRTRLALSFRVEAEWRESLGADARGPVEKGLAQARLAHELDPTSSEALVELGRLLAARARLGGRAATALADRTAAAGALQAAVAANPRSAEPHAALASLAVDRLRVPGLTRDAAPAEAIAREGIASAERALAIDPLDGDARRAKDALLALRPPR